MIIQGVDLVGMTDDTGTFVNSFDSSEYMSSSIKNPLSENHARQVFG